MSGHPFPLVLEDKMAASVAVLRCITETEGGVDKRQERNFQTSGHGLSDPVKCNLREHFVLRRHRSDTFLLQNQRELIYRRQGLFPAAKENNID